MRKALLKYLRDHSILMAEGKQESPFAIWSMNKLGTGLTLADAADYSFYVQKII